MRICLVCNFVWCLLALGTCTYLVFWRHESGWWFLLALVIAELWNCKPLRSLEQIAADRKEDADD